MGTQNQFFKNNILEMLKKYVKIIIYNLYWIVQKVRADVEGKLKRRKF